ncbi:hypothetical protein KIH87_11590 [Paraneptunicella aestuarii]|uniref:hypothetical protein n=1 Tax=Paraneptunicella aestuarii TaxID=2831148 RepID=UPI001E4BFE15|nr:hypothetical protein [Paraneptunicella aestuarii]UAA37365.1 hypothetical protein KIH87_11590 [Paraneptunicella aestuarii]
MPNSMQLIALGVNQTLLIALLPQLAVLLGFGHNPEDWGLLLLVMNANLPSYWLASGWWGKKITCGDTNQISKQANYGFILSISLFVTLLLLIENGLELPQATNTDSMSLLNTLLLTVLALCRFASGAFASAFLPLAQTNITQTPEAYETNISKLSHLSSLITLGRFIGPILVLLPFPLVLHLIIPALLILVSLIQKSRTTIIQSNEAQNASVATAQKQIQVFKLLSKPGLTAALLTTSMVAMTQLVLLPFIAKFGYTEKQASHYYAQLMIYLSVFVIASQRWLLPYLIPKIAQLTKSQTAYPLLLSLCLILGTVLLCLPQQNWPTLLLALACIAIAIAGLPACYTHQLFEQHHIQIPRAQISAAIAQVHTLGHLLGTAVTAALLAQNLNIAHVQLALATLLLFCIYALFQKHTI